MKLRRLELERLPGIGRPLVLDRLGEGIHLVIGPNGSGKSSLCRAVRGLLWPSRDLGEDARVSAIWEDAGGRWSSRLAAGRVAWQREGAEADPPGLPDPHLAHCYTLGLSDLLRFDGERDRDLARALRREMAGGYEVAPLLADARKQAAAWQRVAREQKALSSAVEARRAQEERQRALAGDEERLADLRRQRDRAREAQREIGGAELARDVLRQRTGLAALDERIRPIPEARRRLTGDELASLDALEADLEGLRQECDRLRALAEEATLARDGSGFAGSCPLAPADLDAWRERVRRLRQLEGEAERLRREDGVARESERAARSALGLAEPGEGEAPVHAPLALDELARLEEGWSEGERLRERSIALEARRQALRATEEEPETASVEALHDGAQTLRDWLAAARLRPRRRTAWATAAVAVAAAGAAFFVLPPEWGPPAAAIAGALALGLAGALRFGLPRARPGDREAGERLARAGVEAPRAWEPVAVGETLRALEVRAVRAARAAQREDECARLAAEARALDEEAEKLRARRAALAPVLGFDPAAEGLALREWAERMRTWQGAQESGRRARAGLAALEQEHAAGLAALGRFLESHGEAPPVDAAAGEARLVALERRLQAFLESSRRADDLRLQLGRRLEERKKLDERRKARLSDWGLPAADPVLARHQLERWLAERPAVQELLRRRDQAAAALRLAEEQLGDRGERLESGPEDLEERIARLREEAGRADGIAAEIGRIEERLDEAGRGRSLEEAMEVERRARERLVALREDMLEAETRAWLLEAVSSEHEERSQPAVLREAADSFARFTHGRYGLRVDGAAADARFLALDTGTARGLGLEALSDGTRSQLLLASRLAFARSAETGSPLPLFLDEALSSSDPERFRAVATSLIEDVRAEGRQVFYLSCDPTDVERWRERCASLGAPEPRVVDLAALGGDDPWDRPAADLAPARLPEVPAPRPGEAAEAYARRLAVPPAQPFDAAGSLHLFHLLRDDLPLLHRLLERGRVATLGQWRGWSRTAAASGLVSEAERARIDARVLLAEALVEAFSEGRGRPVTRSALREALGSTQTFLDRLDALAEAVGRDPRRFWRRVEERDARVKGFQSRSREQLRQGLLDARILDPRPVLDRAAVHARVAGAVSGALREGHLGLETLQQRFDELWRQLSGPADPHPPARPSAPSPPG